MPQSAQSGRVISLKSRAGEGSPFVVNRPTFVDPEIPYYDAELGVAQSEAHKDVIAYLLPLFEYIARLLGLRSLSDNAIRYPKAPGENKYRYGDLVLARQSNKKNPGSGDLLLVMEVVSTTHKAKLLKDTDTQKDLNEQHGVQEFVLIWPDLDDDRVIDRYRYNKKSKCYEEIGPDEDGFFHASLVPGLAFKPAPRPLWTKGRKLNCYYQGNPLGDVGQERERADREHEAKLEAETRADREHEAKLETEEKMQMLIRQLREHGIEPGID